MTGFFGAVGWALLLGCFLAGRPVHGAEAAATYSATELRKLVGFADAILEEADAQGNEPQARQHQAFEIMSFAELKAHFSEPPGQISSRERRGWIVAQRLAEELLAAHEHGGPKAKDLAEVLDAIKNNGRRPAPTSIHFLMPPILFWDHLHNPIARGEAPAANLRTNPAERDLSRLDPGPSTFWQRPTAVVSQNLFAGFGRSAMPRYETNVWEYAGPKTSWGGCPGFDLRCGSLEIKVKLAETRSEPFTGRIFHALGFHADATDHAPFLKIKYSRRLWREFHLRKDLIIGIRTLFFRVHTINLQKRHDPFAFIAEAVLRDGRRLTGKELKKFLLREARGKFPEDNPANFRPENEAQVDYVVTAAANVQLRDTPFKAVGPWRFEGLGREHRRELRGAGLLAAWLGWYDSRFENTRLKVCETNGQLRLAHFFNDLGGGLGQSVGVISRPMESPRLFRRTFTAPPRYRGKGRMTTPFRIRHFEPLEDTAAFEQMTVDDARWMARLIGQLSEEQIVQALTASGFTPADVRVYTEKLISRRDRMIRDLGLSGELPPLRAR